MNTNIYETKLEKQNIWVEIEILDIINKQFEIVYKNMDHQ